jgi:hypothetical protein
MSEITRGGLNIREAGKRWFWSKKAYAAHAGDWRQYQEERIGQERARIQQAHGELGLLVLDILANHDPLRIVCEANPTEYEPVVRTILPRLQSARCAEDTQRIAQEEVVHWLGEAKVGRELAYVSVGKDLWETTKRAGFHS